MKKINPSEKKKYLIRGIILLIVGFAALGFVIYNMTHTDEKQNEVVDAEKFKNEYEALNGKKNSNDLEYPTLSIDKNNPIKYVSYEELSDILSNGSGIVYFGFPECPWCRNAVPVLLDAAKEQNINEIYYFNAYDIRDEKSLDENGNVITEKKGSEEYSELVTKLYDYLDVYKGLNDDTIKRLYFPNVFFILNGKVVGNHMGTVASQENPRVALTDEQYNELKNIYVENIKKVFNYECNDGC